MNHNNQLTPNRIASASGDRRGYGMLIIGYIDDPEFTGWGNWLKKLDDVSIETARDLAQCHRRPSSAPRADLIVVLERHPDEHQPQDVRRLIERHPLARIVCGYGPWSESALRTRGAWPIATWTPADLLADRALAELSVIRGERSPLPITADRADAFEQTYCREAAIAANSTSLSGLKVAVDACDPEYRAMLEDELLLRFAELAATSEAWDLLLFDAHPESQRMRVLEQLLQSRQQGRVVVLHEMPCASVQEAWSSERLGTDIAMQVVSKLAPLSQIAMAAR